MRFAVAGCRIVRSVDVGDYASNPVCVLLVDVKGTRPSNRERGDAGRHARPAVTVAATMFATVKRGSLRNIEWVTPILEQRFNAVCEAGWAEIRGMVVSHEESERLGQRRRE